jgi:hypothetical protein
MALAATPMWPLQQQAEEASRVAAAAAALTTRNEVEEAGNDPGRRRRRRRLVLVAACAAAGGGGAPSARGGIISLPFVWMLCVRVWFGLVWGLWFVLCWWDMKGQSPGGGTNDVHVANRFRSTCRTRIGDACERDPRGGGGGGGGCPSFCFCSSSRQTRVLGGAGGLLALAVLLACLLTSIDRFDSISPLFFPTHSSDSKQFPNEINQQTGPLLRAAGCRPDRRTHIAQQFSAGFGESIQSKVCCVLEAQKACDGCCCCTTASAAVAADHHDCYCHSSSSIIAGWV